MEKRATRTDFGAVPAVLEAARFAAQKHADQRRKGAAGEPYINHLIEVASLVAKSLSAPDIDLVVAALLHDTLEDTRTTKDELAERFGTDVAELVSEVTDDKSVPKAERKRLQIETAPSKSERAQTIKLADKIANLRSVLFSPPSDWNYQRKKDYFTWAKQVVDGLSAPNPALKAEFDATLQLFDRVVGDRPEHGSRIVNTTEQALKEGKTGDQIIGGVRPPKKS